MVVLVPPRLSLSSLFPLSPPFLILQGSLSPAARPFPICILCFLSVRVISRPPPQQRLISRRPSGGFLRWPLPVDANQSKSARSGGVPAPRVFGVSPPYAVGGTWLEYGLGGVEDGAPRNCP